MPSQELGVGAGTGFPNFIDTIQVFQNLPTVVSDGPTRFDAEVINDLLDAVLAIQTAAGTDPVGSTNTQVTDTELKALLGTDITLVASPGANKAVIVHGIYFVFDVTTTGYTLGSAALAIGYGGDNADVQAITEAGFLDQTADQQRIYHPNSSNLVPTANQPIVLRSTVADLTGGNAANTLSIRVFHSTVSTIAFT